MISGQQQSFYTVKDVSASDFIRGYATYLKKNNKIQIPPWTEWVKTGVRQEGAPIDEDWVYVRVAAVARKIYLRGHFGVGLLKRVFGGRQRAGNTPEHFRTAGGKLIRWALQTLETLKVVKKDKKSALNKKSRVITKEGQTDLNRIATEVALARIESESKKIVVI